MKRSLLSLAFLVIINSSMGAMEDEAVKTMLVIKSGNKEISINKGHTFHCKTLKTMFDVTGIPDSIRLDELQNSLILIQRFFKYGYTQSHRIKKVLRSHSIEELSDISNAFNFLNSDFISNAALNKLAAKLTHKDTLFKCLTDLKGLYHLQLSGDMQRALAQKMIAHLPGLKTGLLLFQQRVITNTLRSIPLIGHVETVNCICFSPDSTKIASASQDKTIRLWNSATGTLIGNPLTGHKENVTEVCFSPDGKYLASGSYDTTIRLWNSVTGEAARDPLMGHTESVLSVSFSPDGKKLASSSNDGTIRLWDSTTGSEIIKIRLGRPPSRIRFTHDGGILASQIDNQICFWDSATGARISNGYQDLTGPKMDFFCLSPDGTFLATVNNEYESILVYKLRTNRIKKEKMYTGQIKASSICFSSDSSILFSGSRDGSLRFWDMEKNVTTQNHLSSWQNTVPSVSMSPNGLQLALAHGHIIEICNLADKNLNQWFLKESKPEQIAALAYLYKCINDNKEIEAIACKGIANVYPGLLKISLPEKFNTLMRALMERINN
jgi:WD40 repeat protein